MKKLSVSLGIPAYNEEDNIGHLIKALISQKQKNYFLEEILICSDGSTDKTEDIVTAYKNSKIKLTRGKQRLGQQFRQNQIFSVFQGDILVLFEGDILPSDSYTITKLIEPLINGNSSIGMVVGSAIPVEPKNLLEKILFHGTLLKKKLFEKWRNGQNIYNSGGHSMRAFSKKFTELLIWPKDVPEDAYAYLRLKQLGLSMVRQPSAKVYMRNVTTFVDRKRQVSKFITGKKALEKYFSKEVLKSEYDIPKSLIVKTLFWATVKNPLWSLLFLAEIVLNRILTTNRKAFNPLYEIYKTSKKLTENKIFPPKKLEVSVGIPIYNEQENISFLIKSLLNQKITKGGLEEIIIFDDGSKDKTLQIVGAFEDKRIKIIENKERDGQWNAQNQLTRTAKGDVLVLLNGDVLPIGKYFIDKLIEPIICDEQVGLVGADTISAEPKRFFEKVIHLSHEFKKSFYKKIENGNNIYMCHGRARAFTKSLYKKIVWPANFPEDAYSYLFSEKMGFKFVFANDARVIFRSPSNFADYLRQSKRFLNGKRRLGQIFSSDFIKKTYRIPVSLVLISVLKYLILKPTIIIPYLLINFYARYIYFDKEYTSRWKISISSKRVV